MRKSVIIARTLIILLASSLLAACGGITNHKVNHQLANQQRDAPKKIIVLPIDIRVHEISAGGATEEISDWSMTAKENIKAAIKSVDDNRQDFELITIPEITEDEILNLEEHVALYERVYLSTLTAAHPATGPHWKERIKKFEYTLGNGLTFLTEKSDADSALILIGEDYISTSGRKAAIVMAAMLGAHIQGGHAFLSAGIVNLKSGDVLWVDHSLSVGNLDLRKPEDVEIIVNNLFNDYPGIEAFLGSI